MSSTTGINTVYTIADVGTNVQVAFDTTNSAVGAAFAQYIQQIINIYNEGADDTGTGHVFTASDFNALLAAYNNLVKLANGTDPANAKGLINLQMAIQLDAVNKTFDIGGLTALFQAANTHSPANFASLTSGQQTSAVTAMGQWFDLSAAGLGNVLSSALGAGQNSWRSIQSMVETVYIAAGNNLIGAQMTQMQEALGLTTQATQLLTSLQNLYNKVQPAPTGSFNLNTGTSQYGSSGNEAAFMSYYTQGASNGNWTQSGEFVGFDNPIALQVTATPADQVLYTQTQGQLQTLITQIEAVTGVGYGDPGYANSLQQTLQQVLSDMQANPNISTWIIDNMDSAPGTANGALAGNNGNHLATSQASAQSLNTTQQEQVQSTLFLFQQFYQSASSIIQQMAQTLQTMAQGIAQ